MEIEIRIKADMSLDEQHKLLREKRINVQNEISQWIEYIVDNDIDYLLDQGIGPINDIISNTTFIEINDISDNLVLAQIKDIVSRCNKLIEFENKKLKDSNNLQYQRTQKSVDLPIYDMKYEDEIKHEEYINKEFLNLIIVYGKNKEATNSLSQYTLDKFYRDRRSIWFDFETYDDNRNDYQKVK